MTPNLGDLAQSFIVRQQAVDLRQNLERLTTELATGETSNLPGRLGGDFTVFASLDRSLDAADAHAQVARETATVAAAMQTALGGIQGSVETTGRNLFSVVDAGNFYLLDVSATDAADRLSAMVQSLNTHVADRAVFAGVDTTQTPLANADTMLDAIRATITAPASAEDVRDAVTAWFDTAGGGFETDGYLATAAPTVATRLSERAEVNLAVTAADPELREAMKGFAMAALITDDFLDGGAEAKGDLGRFAAEHLLQSTNGLVNLRAGLGAAQSRIDEVLTEVSAEAAALELARSDIVAIDPYETAVELQTAETQLTSLYTITARLSGLSLVNFLR